MESSDGDRIRDLLGTYCRLIDAGDFAGTGRLFADATLSDEHGTVLATGADEVAALYAATVRLHADGTPRTQHVVANTSFDPPGDDGSVVARSSYVVFQATDELSLRPVVTGGYVDTFARAGGEWRFADRRIAIGLTGDLSQHLAIVPEALR